MGEDLFDSRDSPRTRSRVIAAVQWTKRIMGSALRVRKVGTRSISCFELRGQAQQRVRSAYRRINLSGSEIVPLLPVAVSRLSCSTIFLVHHVCTGGLVITLFDVYALWTVRSQLSHTPQLAHNIPFSPAMVVISALGVAYVAYLARRS